MQNRKKIFKIGIIILFAVIGCYMLVSLYFINHFYFGSQINSISISGKTLEEVDEEVESISKNYCLTIIGRDNIEDTILGKDIDLNYNIKKWEENVIYPQAIVIIDLNNIKYINDNYGHTEGDEVIKKAASILIINQEENTDIVRTDGNEFLVYMVGYDEKKVIEYTRKLSKEFKNLPHEFGATLGYSMILDNVKTIDDAINEATLSMRQAKEKL